MPAFTEMLSSDILFNAILPKAHWRDQRDLMERPFFSLAKRHRTIPIDYRNGDIRILVSGDPEHGIATIWDADILIWATSQIVAAMERGLTPSPHMRIIPYQLLQDIGRSTGRTDYGRLKRALNRLRTTTVTTTLRQDGKSGDERFTWISDWQECVTRSGRHEGIELTLANWFHRGATERKQVLTVHSGYFNLPGGVERWLYRLARKHAVHQPGGWRFSFRQLHHKSGSPIRPSDFALLIRRVAKRRRLLDYMLSVETAAGQEMLRLLPLPTPPVQRL